MLLGPLPRPPWLGGQGARSVLGTVRPLPTLPTGWWGGACTLCLAGCEPRARLPRVKSRSCVPRFLVAGNLVAVMETLRGPGDPWQGPRSPYAADRMACVCGAQGAWSCRRVKLPPALILPSSRIRVGSPGCGVGRSCRWGLAWPCPVSRGSLAALASATVGSSCRLPVGDCARCSCSSHGSRPGRVSLSIEIQVVPSCGDGDPPRSK